MPLIAEPRGVGAAAPATGSPKISYVPVPVDNAPIPEIAMVALKIYAFGGLAFMMAIILGALSYWIWIVVIRREFADSPPELDLNPERMRKREIARIARRKAQKERKLAEQRRREEKKFTPPPIILEKRQKRPRSSTMPVSGTVGISQATLAVATPSPRKSSLSTSPVKQNKRVSWASSTSTLDVNGNASMKPLDADSIKSGEAVSFPSSGESRSTLLPVPPHDGAGYYAPPPRARTAAPRTSTGLTPRERSGKDMVSTMTPDTAVGWAKPVDPLAKSCTCSTSVDPLDRSGRNMCEIHRYTV